MKHPALEKAAETHWRRTKDSPRMYPTDDFTAGALWLKKRIKTITAREMGKKSSAVKVLGMFLDEALNGKSFNPARKGTTKEK